MKEYREKEIKYLYISYIFLLLYWSTNVFQTLAQNGNGSLRGILSIMDVVAIAGVISLIAFILDSIIDSDAKDKLVGLFFIPRSGATFFSRLIEGKIVDDRFSKEEAEKRYACIIKELPTNKKKKLAFENNQWYKIYVKFQEKDSIFQAQRDYLLCRDLYTDTIAFAVTYLVAILVFSNKVFFSSKLIIAMLVVAALTNIAAHIKMNRFVNDVIALDIAISKQQDSNKGKEEN